MTEEAKVSTLAALVTPPRKYKAPECPIAPLKRRVAKRRQFSDVIDKKFAEMNKNLFGSK